MIFVASSNDRLFILKILWVAWAMLGGFCTLYVIDEVTYIVTIYIYTQPIKTEEATRRQGLGKARRTFC